MTLNAEEVTNLQAMISFDAQPKLGNLYFPNLPQRPLDDKLHRSLICWNGNKNI